MLDEHQRRGPRRLKVSRIPSSTGSGPSLGAMVPAGPSASRRIQRAVRSSALVWELGQSRQPLFRAHRQYLRLRFGPLEIASGSGGRVVAKQRLGLMSPSVSLVCAPLQRARVNRVTAECLAKNPLGVEQNIRNLPNLALVSPQFPWILCPTAVSGVKIQQVQSLHVVASQTAGNPRQGKEPPRLVRLEKGQNATAALPPQMQARRTVDLPC